MVHGFRRTSADGAHDADDGFLEPTVEIVFAALVVPIYASAGWVAAANFQPFQVIACIDRTTIGEWSESMETKEH